MKSQYKLHLGNTKKIITDMIDRNEKVDMIFTSPPYYSMRKNYSGNDDGEIGSIHVDDYADWFLEFTDLFLKVLKPNGSFFLNINDKIHLDPETREANEAYKKLYEYYKYYYDKHNK